jgi:putative transposase
MKKSRYRDEQVFRILQAVAKAPLPEVAKRYGVSEQSVYGWRMRFTDMMLDEVKELNSLIQENEQLKSLLAEQKMRIEVIKETTQKDSA